MSSREFGFLKVYQKVLQYARFTHGFGFVEAGHADVSLVMAVEVNEVSWGTQPEVKARHPYQYSILEALGQVWVGRIPRAIPVLSKL